MAEIGEASQEIEGILDPAQMDRTLATLAVLALVALPTFAQTKTSTRTGPAGRTVTGTATGPDGKTASRSKVVTRTP